MGVAAGAHAHGAAEPSRRLVAENDGEQRVAAVHLMRARPGQHCGYDMHPRMAAGEAMALIELVAGPAAALRNAATDGSARTSCPIARVRPSCRGATRSARARMRMALPAQMQTRGVGDHQSGMVDRRAIDVVERGRGDDLAQAIEVVGHEATSAA